MPVLLIIFLIIIYFLSLFTKSVMHLIGKVYSINAKETAGNKKERFFISFLDVVSYSFEILFVADLVYLFNISLRLSIVFSLALTFVLTFLFVEILTKTIIRNFYEAENVNLEIADFGGKLCVYFFFKTPFFILPKDIKNAIKESPEFSHFFHSNGKTIVTNETKESNSAIEKEIIDKVYELGDQGVYEAMRPRTEIVGVDISNSMEEVHKAFVESGYSKLIVYDENVDNIKGVIIAYDLFKSPPDLKSILREVIFVPESKKSIEMLNLFLNKHISIAVVVDEFGGTAGIVTMEDIIEELFGEIKDEYDVEENICKKVSENSYVLSGKVEIDYINETFDLDIPYGDYETIGGLIITHSGKIPAKGEIVKIGSFAFQIIRSNNVKIDLVKMIVAGSYKAI